MAIVRSIVRTLLPAPIRRSLRACHRDLVFRRAIRNFSRDPQSVTGSGRDILADLIYGWGNEIASAQEEYLAACIEEALNCEGPILECGSGLTTILVGLIADKRGITMWTLEHQKIWGDKVRAHLARYGIKSVRLRVHPLKEYSGFSWYEPPLDVMPDQFEIVICDGPPRKTPGGRYGLAPVMGARLRPGCIILLDDGAREGEQAVARIWASELDAAFTTIGTRKPYIRIVTGHGPR